MFITAVLCCVVLCCESSCMVRPHHHHLCLYSHHNSQPSNGLSPQIFLPCSHISLVPGVCFLLCVHTVWCVGGGEPPELQHQAAPGGAGGGGEWQLGVYKQRGSELKPDYQAFARVRGCYHNSLFGKKGKSIMTTSWGWAVPSYVWCGRFSLLGLGCLDFVWFGLFEVIIVLEVVFIFEGVFIFEVIFTFDIIFLLI